MDDAKIQQSIITNYKSLLKFRKDSKEVKSVETNKEIIQNGGVTIYCDGGCTPNPGKAGSGVAVYKNGKLSELRYGLYKKRGTNNVAELGALFQSLLIAENEVRNGNKVKIKCDSMYSINCIKTWAISWEKKNWIKKKGIKNLEIIKKSYYLYNQIKKDVELSHIKAHAGHEGNELADRMAVYAIQELKEDFVKYSKEINIKEILKLQI
jgi:ribonuclease HI